MTRLDTAPLTDRRDQPERRGSDDKPRDTQRRESGVGDSAPSLRLDQLLHAVRIRIAQLDSLWELTVPDVDVESSSVRVTLHEFAGKRAGEASALLDWDDYIQVRGWLRCIPDGRPAAADLEPSLRVIRAAFRRVFGALALGV